MRQLVRAYIWSIVFLLHPLLRKELHAHLGQGGGIRGLVGDARVHPRVPRVEVQLLGNDKKHGVKKHSMTTDSLLGNCYDTICICGGAFLPKSMY